VNEVQRQDEQPSNREQEVADRQTALGSAEGTAALLVSELRERLPTVLEDEPVQLGYLYGSSVTGQTTPFSDVDIALILGDPVDPLERLRLILRVQLALADRCGIDHADVRVIDEAPLVFRGRVVSEGVLVYARDEGERIRFETATRMRYFDYLPIHRALQVTFFEALRERGLYD
jgi:uncharacterized protein